MPRTARQFSQTGYLHLIVRGIGRQILFEDRQDHLFFLSILEKNSTETSIAILAYCLMDNHAHLLAHDPECSVSLMMKKIGVSYSNYFNRKYDRTGHLFQDRFRSEKIENEGHLLTVFRYILNNPRKAGLSAVSYEWSSLPLYESENTFVNTAPLRELIGDSSHYMAFLNAEDENECMEYENPKHDDQWAAEVLRKTLNGMRGSELQHLKREDRNAALYTLKQKGLSIRQLERLTGINRGVIQQAKRVTGDGSH